VGGSLILANAVGEEEKILLTGKEKGVFTQKARGVQQLERRGIETLNKGAGLPLVATGHTNVSKKKDRTQDL